MTFKERVTIVHMIRILRKEIHGDICLRIQIPMDDWPKSRLGFRRVCLYKAMRLLSIRKEFRLSRTYSSWGTIVHCSLSR